MIIYFNNQTSKKKNILIIKQMLYTVYTYM